jgi:hypothetical protein
MLLYSYFRNALGDFSGENYDEDFIDNLCLSGDQFVLKMVGKVPADEYIRALSAVYVYLRSYLYTEYNINGGVTEIKVGDVTEKYGRNEVRLIVKDIWEDLRKALIRVYGSSIVGIDRYSGLEEGVLINDLEE